MKERTLQSAIVVLAVLITAGSVPGATVPMAWYGTSGQTQIFRGDLGGIGLGDLNTVLVTDAVLGGGSAGVFSGFDLDFIVLDQDGDLATAGDQILPFETPQTYVTPGTVRPSTSYLPTPLHPGILFGLNADNSIDFATATIRARDASYDGFALAVDTSDGWVTLGDGGMLTAAFPQTTLTSSGMYLFVGEVGNYDEGLRATIDVTNFPTIPAPGAIVLGTLGAGLVGWLRRRRVL
ncbi:MAG: hypothetical protein M1376_20690 [Planctomycetes bacterium]|nr:hypothetical protein [Planctomycetota bacterium]